MKVVLLVCLLVFFGSSAAAAGVATSADDFADVMREMKKTIEILQADVTVLHGNVDEDKRTIRTLQSELENVKTTSTASTKDIAEMIGTSYVRWGRKTCNAPATIVYQGYIGGSTYSSTGGGSNHVCLPNNPQFHASFAGTSGYSIMYGAEYDLQDANYVFSKNNSNGVSLHNFPAACAVCYVKNLTTVVTIPARVDCPIGWTKEYQGYMMAARSTSTAYYRTEYICVDEAPDSADGGVGQSQGEIYLVEMGCGSLPCSVYVDGTELNCVVCSR